MLQSTDNTNTITDRDTDPNAVLFKHDRIYRHNIFWVNYTAYDVRRSQDVVNASTSHHNIMMLADTDDSIDSSDHDHHPFKYTRVLGVYHANVLYAGHGLVDYQPRRINFLWVRWYENTGVVPNGWKYDTLDCIKFPPMAKDGAFEFVDP